MYKFKIQKNCHKQNKIIYNDKCYSQQIAQQDDLKQDQKQSIMKSNLTQQVCDQYNYQNQQRQLKRKQYQNFIFTILQHKQTEQDYLQLQQMKQSTQLQIQLKYMRSKINKKYIFPLIKFQNIKTKQCQQNNMKQLNNNIKQQKNNKEKQHFNQYNKQFKNNKIKQFYQQSNSQQYQKYNKNHKQQKNSQKYTQQYQQYIQQYQQSNQQELLLFNKLQYYDLNQQNHSFINHISFNQQYKQQLLTDKRITYKYFKPITIIQPTLSSFNRLQKIHINQQHRINHISSNSKTQPSSSQTKPQTLQSLRIARLRQKKKNILAIRSEPKLKAKNYNLFMFSPQHNFNISTYDALIIQSNTHQIQSHIKSNNNLLIQSKINSKILTQKEKNQNPQHHNFKIQEKYIFNNMDQSKTYSNFKPSCLKNKSKSQKKFKSPRQFHKQQILFPSIIQKNNFQKNVRFQQKVNSYIKNKKIKTLQSQFQDGVQLIIGKKLKTQSTTPEYQLSPQKISSPKSYFHIETDLSKIFSNQKLKHLGINIHLQLRKDFQKTKKKFNCTQKLKFKFEEINSLSKNKIQSSRNSSKLKRDNTENIDSKCIEKQIFVKIQQELGSRSINNSLKSLLMSKKKTQKKQKLGQKTQKKLLNKLKVNGKVLQIKGRQKNICDKKENKDEHMISNRLLKQKFEC